MQRKRATVREDLCEQLMQGEPLDQERRVVGALIDSLEPQDRLELVEFSTSARRWRRSAAEATASSRADARRWLGKLQAGGGTEMRASAT